MPDISSATASFDAKSAFVSAVAIPFPSIDKTIPTEREPRLATIIANLEHHNAEVRSNLIQLASKHISQLPLPLSYPPSPATLAIHNADTIANITALSPSDPENTPKPPPSNSVPGAFANISSAIRATDALIAEFDRNASEGLKLFKDSLKRTRDQRDRDDGPQGTIEQGLAKVARMGSWPASGPAPIGPGVVSPEEEAERDAKRQRRTSWGVGGAEEGPARPLIDASRDPRKRRSGA